MQRSVKEELLWAIDLVRTWEWKFQDNELLYLFSRLNELPKDKYPEEWAELREAFRNNEEMNHPTVRENLRLQCNVEDGNWW